MKIVKRDGIFVAVIVAVLIVIYVSTLKETGKKVPDDEKHSRFYDAMHKGGDRMEVEKGCPTCHNSNNISLSKAHPPKEQCLVCHKLVQARK